MHVIVDNAFIQILFQNTLNGCIYGQLQAVTVLCFFHLVVLKRHIGTNRIFNADHSACCTGKVVVVVHFQPRESLSVRTYKSQNGGSQCAVRVVPLVVGFQQNTAALVVVVYQFFFQLQDFIPLFGLYLSLQHLVVGTLINLLLNGILIYIKDFCQTGNDSGSGSLFVCFLSVCITAAGQNIFWFQYNLPNAGALCQNLAVCVVNRTTFGCNLRILQLLIQSNFLQAAAVHQLNPNQTEHNDTESDGNQSDEYKHGSAPHGYCWSLCQIPFLPLQK